MIDESGALVELLVEGRDDRGAPTIDRLPGQHVLQKAQCRRVGDAGEGQGDHAAPQERDGDQRGRLRLELVEAVDDHPGRDGRRRQQDDREQPRSRRGRQVGQLLEADEHEGARKQHEEQPEGRLARQPQRAHRARDAVHLGTSNPRSIVSRSFCTRASCCLGRQRQHDDAHAARRGSDDLPFHAARVGDAAEERDEPRHVTGHRRRR